MNTDIFIYEKVMMLKNDYYKMILLTKLRFFEFLKANKSLKEFEKELIKIWSNSNYDFMNRSVIDLEKMISELNGNYKTDLDIKIENLFEIKNIGFFEKYEDKFLKDTILLYENRLETINKSSLDKGVYLSNYIDKYDNLQANIPYFNKNGTVHSWHNIADYLSMVFNSNLTKSGWNRTLYDAKVLNNDLVYLPAHTFSCPKCMKFQGKVYSISGKTKGYPTQSEAINGGIGHPNCKHPWLLYWEGITDIQKEKYNTSDWEEKYNTKQKINTLNLEIKKTNINSRIYKDLNQMDKYQNEENKILKYKSKINELEKTLK